MSAKEREFKHLAGKFLVLDGPDGCGKTTQQGLLAKRLEDSGLDVVCGCDPGGTEIGDRIRSVLLDFDLSVMDATCETLLFMASRAQLCSEVIRPALEKGKTVLCDRFVSATCAYQGAVGFDIAKVIELARLATGDLWPHLTMIIDIDMDAGFARIGRKFTHAQKKIFRDVGQRTLFHDVLHDAMEARMVDFHQRVHNNFKTLHEYYPSPLIYVDGSNSVEAVQESIAQAVRSHVDP